MENIRFLLSGRVSSIYYYSKSKMDAICYLFKNSLLVATGGTRIQWVVIILYGKIHGKIRKGGHVSIIRQCPLPIQKNSLCFLWRGSSG